MINRFNKIIENVFIPADDDDIRNRQDEFAKNIGKREIENKKKFEKLYGKLEEGDILIPQYSDGMDLNQVEGVCAVNIKIEKIFGNIGIPSMRLCHDFESEDIFSKDCSEIKHYPYTYFMEDLMLDTLIYGWRIARLRMPKND